MVPWGCAEHSAALVRVRELTAREAMEGLASALLSEDFGAASTGLLPASAPVAAAEVAVQAVAATEVVEAAVAEDEDEDDCLPLGEPYIETILCTTCNDCIQMGEHVFQYNEDKQAILIDPAKAPFDLLVRAAEGCPAACIYPGLPRDDDATVTPELVARAKAIAR